MMFKPNIVIASGVSGAGKTTLASTYESKGYRVMEEVPFAMLEQLLTLFAKEPTSFDKTLLIVNLGHAKEFMEKAKENPNINVLTIGLDCSTEVLFNRYRLTRHIHPLQPRGYSLEEALKKDDEDIKLLMPYLDVYFDTSSLSEKDFRKKIVTLIGQNNDGADIVFTSFGYKYGVPRDAEIILDARILKNPYWVEELKAKTGLDDDVKAYIETDPNTDKYIDSICKMLDIYLSKMKEDGRSFVQVYVGCSGGQHRSVYVAERLYSLYKEKYICSIVHRELSRIKDGKKE